MFTTRLCVICQTPITRQDHDFCTETPTCSRKCQAEQFHRRYTGSGSVTWKGGRIQNEQGYILIYSPGHPHAHNKYVREHVLVMEQILGRYLLPGETVHHKNHDRADNHPDNLALYQSNGEHLSTEHGRQRKQSQCPCGRKPNGRGLCGTHYAQYRRLGIVWGHGLSDKDHALTGPFTTLESESDPTD
jgi:hypothetical protein